LTADERSSAGRGGDRFLETAEEGGDRCLELVTAAGGDGDLLLFLTVPGLCSPDLATFGGRPIASKELTGSEAWEETYIFIRQYIVIGDILMHCSLSD
jgi:hypothetical protein